MFRFYLQTCGALAIPMTPIWVLLLKNQNFFIEFSGIFYSYSIAVFFGSLSLDITFARNPIKTKVCISVLAVTCFLSAFCVGIFFLRARSGIPLISLYLATFFTAVMSYFQNCAMVDGCQKDLDRTTLLRAIGCLVAYASVPLFDSSEIIFFVFSLGIASTTCIEIAIRYFRPNIARIKRNSSIPGPMFFGKNIFTFFNFSFPGIVNAIERHTISMIYGGGLVALYLTFSSILGTLTYIGVGHERTQYGKIKSLSLKNNFSRLVFLSCVAVFPLSIAGAYLINLKSGAPVHLNYHEIFGESFSVLVLMCFLVVIHVSLYFTAAPVIFTTFKPYNLRLMGTINAFLVLGFVIFSLNVSKTMLGTPKVLIGLMLLFWLPLILSDGLRLHLVIAQKE